MKVIDLITIDVSLVQVQSIAQIKISSPSKDVKLTELYLSQREECFRLFDSWTECEQVDVVQHLLNRMCHHQHGQINMFLKPKLQRDFISALPGKIVYMMVDLN